MTFCVPVASGLASRIDSVLPQTQCTRCGYQDCAHYAKAVAVREADINQCPPGGAEGVGRIAALVGRTPIPLNIDYGKEEIRVLAQIDEDWCIGCTLCLEACPTDAILGGNKSMHTVLSEHCTGCELCLPVCPVDCIKMVDISGTATGWDAWSDGQAANALGRYKQHQKRYFSFSPASSAETALVDTKEKQTKIAAVLALARERRTT